MGQIFCLSNILGHFSLLRVTTRIEVIWEIITEHPIFYPIKVRWWWFYLQSKKISKYAITWIGVAYDRVRQTFLSNIGLWVLTNVHPGPLFGPRFCIKGCGVHRAYFPTLVCLYWNNQITLLQEHIVLFTLLFVICVIVPHPPRSVFSLVVSACFVYVLLVRSLQSNSRAVFEVAVSLLFD